MPDADGSRVMHRHGQSQTNRLEEQKIVHMLRATAGKIARSSLRRGPDTKKVEGCPAQWNIVIH